ncbi:MAG: 5'/3'-nucleotidase SurE, partial [Moraxellaceae bacterium]|nr:5'/3'-nucleotidase SurE [Moraxellaceae bacterium]
VVRLLQHWPSLALPPRTLLNVNVPAGELGQLKGFQVARLGHRGPSADVLRLQDPRGHDVFWIGASGDPLDNAPGTDFHAVNEGFVSVTPIDADMTRYGVMQTVEHWVAKA